MKIKDLKINFRYLCGNIACLSVDSIDGESVHNDIENEEAIIIFNSLVGEKENCQTVKTLLKENQELKKQLEYLKSEEYYNQLRFERDMLRDVVDNGEVSKEDKEFIDCTHRNTELLEENEKLKKQSEEWKELLNKFKIQQKEFIKYLEDEIKL